MLEICLRRTYGKAPLYGLLLTFGAAIVLGVVSGVISALNQNRSADYGLAVVVMIGLIIPNFLMAPILQLIFGVTLDWLPVGGWGDGVGCGRWRRQCRLGGNEGVTDRQAPAGPDRGPGEGRVR